MQDRRGGPVPLRPFGDQRRPAAPDADGARPRGGRRRRGARRRRDRPEERRPRRLVFVPSCGHCAAVRRRPARAVRAGRGGERAPARCCRARGASAAATASRSTTTWAARRSPSTRRCRAARCVKIDPELPLDEAALFGCAVLTGVGAVVNTAQVQRRRIGRRHRPRRRRASRRCSGARARRARADRRRRPVRRQARRSRTTLGATHTFNAGRAGRARAGARR